MLIPRRALVIVALATTVAACEAQCSVSTARLSEETMASEVNDETKTPVTATTSFAPDAPAIYVTAKVSNAPDDTRVKAAFYYLEGGEELIADDEVTAGGTRNVSFSLSRPDNGWPAGRYETRLFLNGEESKRLPFTVTAPEAPQPFPAAMSGPSEPAAGQAQFATKQFRDDTFGIAMELPDTWTYRLTPKKDYLFEGPKGTEAYELSVIVQFVTKAANPGSSAAAQLEKLAGELRGAPDGAIKARDSVSIGGVDAPYITATYTAQNASGQAVPFAHTQLVADHGEYYYLISYSGPTPIYQKFLPVFQHLVESFRFTS